MRLSILYVGVDDGTCRQRSRALEALGHHVERVSSGPPPSFWPLQLYRVGNRLDRPPDLRGANRAMLRAVDDRPFDVLWIDKGREVRPGTLSKIRESKPGIAIVAYSPDDMMNPDNQCVQYLGGLGLYDLHVTTKSYNVQELKELGARDVLFIDNAYDPETHRPVELDDDDLGRYGADVGFIGFIEPDRVEQLWRLAEAGIRVKVWGYAGRRLDPLPHPNFTFHGEFLGGLEYAKAICGTKINLGFLRKVNRDLQTTRSIEIPACEGFLLGERTDEHSKLFVEGREAEFFDSFDELLEKSRYYLEHEEARDRVRKAGRRRCIEGGYSNQDRLSGVLSYVAERYLSRGSGSE